MHSLEELANARMPFGRFKDRYLIDLPDAYLVWFRQRGFPKGSLGTMLEAAYEIRMNGLEAMVRELRRSGQG
jgi:uncharacterized protein